MSEQQTGELIQELAAELVPVRPIPPMRVVLAGVIGIWLLVAVAGLAILGRNPALLDELADWRGVGAVFLGLGLAGIGGMVAAIALSIPGREGVVRTALATSLGGMALSAGIATALLMRSPVAALPASWRGDLTCLGIAFGVALLPALGIVWFAGRAAPFRPLMVTLAAAAGTAALGSVVAQAQCPFLDMRHLLVAHVFAPGIGALVLSVPLLIALRRVGRG